jgi:poly(hydroxyalkanoate) depolymerase family esterase
MPRPIPMRARREVKSDPGLLSPLDVPFTNPGALRMMAFIPDDLPPLAPLAVVLHGCTQTAAGYDSGAGWSTLAARHGFALLFPEQVRANNPNTCFNWFEGADIHRGSGEAASIANAVAAIVERYGLNPSRVFITGLSAGGAMTTAMLAAYPDVFAGGAVIAGLPAGIAQGVPEALRAMNSPSPRSSRQLGDNVRAESSFTGPWPLVSVWHGDNDRTVAAANGAAVAAQWADVHGITDDPVERIDGRATSRTWHNGAGVAVVEFIKIAGMGHGTPIEAGRDGATAAPYMLDAGIGSSVAIAVFWGIADRSAAGAQNPKPIPAAEKTVFKQHETFGRTDVGHLIADTLRSVGLMK